jgi:aspartyl-tRNA(Asn)/glutamyl-tRNA(Gln) amidotransferase subunit B
MKYQPTIGLEIHTELATETKMFCDCTNDPTEKHPNIHVCPVCLGHPGTLPVPNKKAIEAVITVGLALGGTISGYSKFDRKNYFYPDLPKGYQISQYDLPLVTGGSLCGVRITRIHLEEDVGKLQHGQKNATLVDYNRAGVPLMELVTEPDIRSAAQAAQFARELQLLLRYLKVSDADMEKGQMRIEPNVSLNMQTKVELKNINSFKAVEAGIEYEIVRQTATYESGDSIRQETRGWDEQKKQTVHQRYKEHAQDYRYFPEPDIPPFETEPFNIPAMRSALPELPNQKRTRLATEYAIKSDQVEALIVEPELANYFEATVSELREKIPAASVQDTFNYLTTDLKGMLAQHDEVITDIKITPEHFAHLMAYLAQGTVMSRQAKDLLARMYETGDDPENLMRGGDFEIISDETQISVLLDDILASNQQVVQDYKNGKTAALQFLVGRAMGALKGKGNPKIIHTVLLKKISHG